MFPAERGFRKRRGLSVRLSLVLGILTPLRPSEEEEEDRGGGGSSREAVGERKTRREEGEKKEGKARVLSVCPRGEPLVRY